MKNCNQKGCGYLDLIMTTVNTINKSVEARPIPPGSIEEITAKYLKKISILLSFLTPSNTEKSRPITDLPLLISEILLTASAHSPTFEDRKRLVNINSLYNDMVEEVRKRARHREEPIGPEEIAEDKDPSSDLISTRNKIKEEMDGILDLMQAGPPQTEKEKLQAKLTKLQLELELVEKQLRGLRKTAEEDFKVGDKVEVIRQNKTISLRDSRMITPGEKGIVSFVTNTYLGVKFEGKTISENVYKVDVKKVKLLGLFMEAATYDSWETDDLFTKYLSDKDDFGVGVFPHRDWISDTQTFPLSPSKPRHQQEHWHRFKERLKRKKLDDEKAKVGKEHIGNPFSDVGGEGMSPGPLPYVGISQSPTTFNAMPMTTSLHNSISLTFEFVRDGVKIVCTWDKEDLPPDINEEQVVARIITFLEQNIPQALQEFKSVKMEDVDLKNRTISLKIGESNG